MKVKAAAKATGKLLLAFAASVIFLWGCLSRDNPWDPVNYSGPLNLEERRQQLQTNLDALLGPVNLIQWKYIRSDSLQEYLKSQNEFYQVVNNTIRADNDGSLINNQDIESQNALLCETGNVLFKILLDSSLLLQFYDSLRAIDSSKYLSYSDTSVLTEKYQEASQLLAGDTLLASGYKDSVFNSISQLRLSSEALFLEVDSSQGVWANYNLVQSQPYNDSLTVLNQNFKSYNDSIGSINNFDCAITVSNNEELISKIDSLKPGDVVNINQGNYTVELFITQSGTIDSPIVITGDPLGRTILGTQPNTPLVLSGAMHIQFKNLSFSSTADVGVLMQNNSDSILFENCDFAANDIGLQVDNSHLTVLNSRFYDNGFGGIVINSSSANPSRIFFDNLLVVRNGASGIQGGVVVGTISHSTFSNNQRDGVFLVPQDGKLNILNNNFAENGVEGFAYFSEFTDSTRTLFRQNNFFKNVGNPIYDSIPNREENYLLDPYFKNGGQLEYRIGPESELYLYSNDSNRIGYWYLY